MAVVVSQWRCRGCSCAWLASHLEVTRAAFELQEELDVDLIMLNPEADPPLVRLVELNKLKYEQNKANKDQRKKQRENR
jgi:translation initiation factor IF-3